MFVETHNLHLFIQAMLASGGIRNTGVATELLGKSEQEICNLEGLAVVAARNIKESLTKSDNSAMVPCPPYMYPGECPLSRLMMCTPCRIERPTQHQ